MKQTTGFYPRLRVDTAGRGAVGQAGGVLLTQAIAASGIGRELLSAYDLTCRCAYVLMCRSVFGESLSVSP